MIETTEIKPGYKKTKLGWIPEDWALIPLSDLSDKIGDGMHSTPKYVDNSNFHFINGNNLKSKKIEINKKTKCVSQLEYDKHKKLLNSMTILLSINGTIGSLAFYNEEKIILGKSAAYINLKNTVSKNYVAGQIESCHIQRVFQNSITGSTIKNLSLGSIRKTKIPVPPLPEQKKIADILSTWDKAIETTQALVHKLKLRKKGLMQQLLTGKKRLPGFKGEWEECVFSDVSNRLTKKNTELDDNVITISAQRGFIRQEDYFNKRVASKTLSGYYLIDKGQFAYNKSYSKGYPMGAFKRLDDFDKAVVTTLYICFEITEKANSDFMVYYFEGGMLVRNLMKIAQEGGRAHGLLNISLGDFFGLKMTLPSTEEQTAIAQVLTKADEEINRTQNYLEQLQEQKKGLMQQLLTGQRRVVV